MSEFKLRAHRLVDSLPDSAGWDELLQQVECILDSETNWSDDAPECAEESGALRFCRLNITARDPGGEIWLGDEQGHFVQKADGELRTSLQQGEYVVEFGLGTVCYSLLLRRSRRLSQEEIETWVSRKRPVPEF